MKERSLWSPKKDVFSDPENLRKLSLYGIRSVQNCHTCKFGSQNSRWGCPFDPIIEEISETEISLTSTCSGEVSILPKDIIMMDKKNVS